MAFYDECLSNVRKVEVIIELGSDPDFAGFNAAMLRGVMIDEVWFLSVSEEELDVCKERGLVSFDGEVIVGAALLDEVVGEFALGQESIGCNGFALDIDGIEKWSGHLDFVSPFDLIITFLG